MVDVQPQNEENTRPHTPKPELSVRGEEEPKDPTCDALEALQQAAPNAARENRKTKILPMGIDIPELSSSEGGGKPYAPEMEQALRKNEEVLKKRASAEALGSKGSMVDLVVPRTVFVFRKLKPKKLILWSSKPLKFPLTGVNDTYARAALKCFECIQRYMGDRAIGHEGRGDAWDIRYVCDKGLCCLPLRNEIYLQIYKQLNQNPNLQSVSRGWEILCVLANCFLPTEPMLSSTLVFVESNAMSQEELAKTLDEDGLSRLRGDERTKTLIRMMAAYCQKRYQVLLHGSSKGRIPTVEEVKHYTKAPFRYNVFGERLEDVMKNPQNVEETLNLPKVLTFLSEAVLLLKGHDCEGIFRVPGDLDSVIMLKMRIERGEYDLKGIKDPAVPASLLKLWVRELAEPVIAPAFYQTCLGTKDVQAAMDIVDQLPPLNRAILKYLAKYLQVVGNPAHQAKTKMTVSNLAMVFAPNLLRCPSDNPLEILKATKAEQRFVKIIVNYLDE